jgi:putative hemin transport protein
MMLTAEAPTTVSLPPHSSAAVRHAYAEARRAGPVRHRDIAASLGVSEGELIGAHAGVPENETRGLLARRLRGPWPAVVGCLKDVSEVMALTRNASCVHEKVGVYREASFGGPAGREMGLVLGGAIDLRVFYSRWAHGFAVDEITAKGMQSSLQFFDAQGTAVHKVFSRARTERGAWVELVARFVEDEQHCGMQVVDAPSVAAQQPDTDIDVAGLRQAWASMRDTHEFFGLQKRFAVTRTQALRLADPRFVQTVDLDSAPSLLHTAAANAVPIMVFVGNPGMIQIHSGVVKKIALMGSWINVLDDGFNLHLRQDHVAQAWIVRKPTADGLVTSLELFDAHGETIAMFFGERKPGRAELCTWRDLVEALAPDGAAQALPCAC